MACGKKNFIGDKKIAAEGKSIAYVDDKVLFVPNTVPGDIVDVQVTRKRKSFIEGMVVKTHRESELRRQVPCTHFGTCGGCKWLNLPYEKQLEFTFSAQRYLTREEISQGTNIERTPALGFHVPGLFDKVVDIEHCCLQGKPSNEIRNFIKEHALRHGLSFYDIRAQQGFLHTLIIRTASTDETMVIIAFGHENAVAHETLLSELKKQFPEITSLMYVINEKLNDNLTDQEILCYSGRKHIFEEMKGLKSHETASTHSTSVPR